MALTPITGIGYLKAGFLGFPKSGKTYTAMLLSVAAHKMFKCKGPIAMFDTEQGAPYIAPAVKALTGQDLVVEMVRSFEQLMAFTREVDQQGIQAVIVDSVTHPYRELCDTYLIQMNDQLKAHGKKPHPRLPFHAWNVLKPKWGLFTAWYLTSKVHVSIAGRAGYEYDYETDDRTGEKELIKTGTKMKTESEFGFEPSLLVEMSRERIEAKGKVYQRVATVIGDRFSVLDGQEFRFMSSKDHSKNLDAVMKAFEPHLALLQPKSTATVDTTTQTPLPEVDEMGNDENQRRAKERDILVEELSGLLDAKVGRTKARQELMQKFFGTFSKTKIESMRVEDLRSNLQDLRDYFDANDVPPPADEPGGDK